ncbi:MAG: hypothetical protein AAFQ82_28180, partial [Myxococcota bacterium]
DVPFFVGLSDAGNHTWVGFSQDSGGTANAVVSELHWAMNPDNPRVIEERPFVDIQFSSGMIAIPPGTFLDRNAIQNARIEPLEPRGIEPLEIQPVEISFGNNE